MGRDENGEERLKQLERLYAGYPSSINGQRQVFSVETLLDILLVLFDECNTPLLKREKHVADFLEVGKNLICCCLCYVHDQCFKLGSLQYSH